MTVAPGGLKASGSRECVNHVAPVHSLAQREEVPSPLLIRRSSSMMATHEGDPARSLRMTVAPDVDPARSPREVENAAPTSLLKVLLEMRKEKLIVPSRQIM